MARTKVFISYSHEDAEWMERLKKQLEVLERQGLLDVWARISKPESMFSTRSPWLIQTVVLE